MTTHEGHVGEGVMQGDHLRVEHLSKSFGDTAVLCDVSFDLPQGEFFTLLGSSGCGKTTTLRIVSGLEKPDTGRVLLGGVDITDVPPNRRPVNTVFQSYALFPTMNVRRNVEYGLRIRHAPKREIDAKAADVLRLVQLEGFENRMPDELSGGQRQRVAIARAVVLEPRVLLLDEPLGALDLKLRRSMQGELKRIQQELGISFIYVTHDQEEALAMSDRIGVLNEGRFEQVGTPEEIYHHPANRYVADFVGESNFVGGHAAGSADEEYALVSIGEQVFRAHRGEVCKGDGDSCTLSIRPEHMLLSALGIERDPDSAFCRARACGQGALTGRVSGLRFLGSAYSAKVQLDVGGEVSVLTPDNPNACLGEPVLVSWMPDGAAVLQGE